MIILTAHSTIDSAVEALRLGALIIFTNRPARGNPQQDREGIQHRQQTLLRSRLLRFRMERSLRQNLIDLDKETETIGQTASPHRFIRTGKLVVDKYHRSATLDGELLDLTTAEFDLLAYLADGAPSPVSPKNWLWLP